MNYRYTATIATVSNAFEDALLDYAVNKFNYYKVLLSTSLIAFILQLLYGLNTEITASYASLPYLLLHAFFILLGYIFFVRALKYLPLGLIGLLESSNLFITLFADFYLGYIKITLYFLFLFAVFICSIILFSADCISQEKSTAKNIKFRGFAYVFGSVLCYATAPYLIKLSDNFGANAITINLAYYLFALPYFCYKYLRAPASAPAKPTNWWNSLLFLSFIIGIFESIYWIFETFSFINDTPTIVVIIEQMRIFLMFLFSVIFKMDKFTIKKAVALILGTASVIGVYYH